MKKIMLFLQFLKRRLKKCNDVVNSKGCIEKITSKSNRLQPVFVLKRFEANKKTDFHIKKTRNSGNQIVPRRGF